jgi:hypothetical protein
MMKTNKHNLNELSNEQFIEVLSRASGLDTEQMNQIIYNAILETMPLPPAELKRRQKEREQDTEERSRDNEKMMKKVRQTQADAIRNEQNCGDDGKLEDTEEEHPLLASPKMEDQPYHDADGRFTDKKNAKCYSYQWKNGSISRMKGRKAVPRKGGVGRKTASGGKGKHLCKTGKPRE